jgi:hypothetical protein
MTPAEAHKRCLAALDDGDLVDARYWLLVLQHLNAEAEEQEIAADVRDA